MGKLSEHYKSEFFACNCGRCKNEVKISLTLVGVLESLGAHLKSRVMIKKGYICSDEAEKIVLSKKDYHSLGKAADVSVQKEKIAQAFRYLEEQPEVTGLGLNIKNDLIHIDLRDKDPKTFIIDGSEEIDLTKNMREKYGLGEEVKKKEIKEPKSIELDV